MFSSFSSGDYSLVSVYCSPDAVQLVSSQLAVSQSKDRLDARVYASVGEVRDLAERLSALLCNSGHDHQVHITDFVKGKKQDPYVIAPVEAVLV